MKITIQTDNAAFTDADGNDSSEALRAECARILRGIANRLEHGQESGSCIDVNGNKVGQWSV